MVEQELNRKASRANRGGRPRKAIDADAIVRLREEGLSWRAVSQKLGLGYGTARRTCLQRAKTAQGEPKPLGVATTATPEPLHMPPVSAPRGRDLEIRLQPKQSEIWRRWDVLKCTRNGFGGARGGAKSGGGWRLMHQLLDADSWTISRDCPKLIECLPTLARDMERNSEDVLKVDWSTEHIGDDAADSARYGLQNVLSPAQVPMELRIAEKITSPDPTIRAIQVRVALAQERRKLRPVQFARRGIHHREKVSY